jgi:hypothetical protein
MNEKDKLWNLCEEFTEKNNISCSETIYSKDSVIVNAYDFIEEICNIVGYHVGYIEIEDEDE